MGATCVTRSVCSKQHRDPISKLTTVGNSKKRIASGSQRGACWQVLRNWESNRHIWIVYASSAKKEVWMDVLNVSHRFFLPLGLLLKLIEHVQQHVHSASIVCASNQYFVALRTAKKSRDRNGRPCFRTFIVLCCLHLSLCWSILSWPESWLSAWICGISDRIHGVTLESACFEAEEEWNRKIWIC